MTRTRISRTREQILDGKKVVNGHIWTMCTNCGGTGAYPSGMIPSGRCRLYCWLNRTTETFGKFPVPVDTYVRRMQEADRREHHRQADRDLHLRRQEALEAERQLREDNPDPRIAQLASLYGRALKAPGVDTAGSLIGQWMSKGRLSEGQWELVAKLIERGVERQELAENSKWVAAVGDRIEASVEVMFTKEIHGTYGTSIMAKLKDIMSGNVLTTFGSGSGLFEIHDERPVGAIRIRGTVAEHSTYQGVKETKLKRVAILTPTASGPG